MSQDKHIEAMEAEIAAMEQETVPPAPTVEVETKTEAVEEPKLVESESEANVEESETDEQKPVERKVYAMPVEKHTKQVEKLKKAHEEEMNRVREEYEAKLKSLKTDVKASDSDEEVENLVGKFAEENEVDPKVVKGILDLAEKRIAKNTKDLLPEVEEFKKERERAKAQAQVAADFDSKVLPLIRKEYPDVTPEHIQRVKESIQELAFTKKYHTYALEDIYRVKSSDFEFRSRASAEPSRGGTGAVMDYESVTPEQLARMSPQEAAKYFEHMDKKGSRYIN